MAPREVPVAEFRALAKSRARSDGSSASARRPPHSERPSID